MIVGIGFDVVEVERIRAVLERHGDRFLRRIYAEGEIANPRGSHDQYWAARFAAKEAAFKALGTGWARGIRWVDVEVRNRPSGQPMLFFRGDALTRARLLGATHVHVTISHTAQLAAAHVLLERRALDEPEQEAGPAVVGARPDEGGRENV